MKQVMRDRLSNIRYEIECLSADLCDKRIGIEALEGRRDDLISKIVAVVDWAKSDKAMPDNCKSCGTKIIGEYCDDCA